VDTNLGPLKIGDIVENKINCYALCYDSLNNVYIYRKISNFYEKHLSKKLVKIKHGFGELICTEDHKIWTTNGYKKAKDINSGDYLCRMREDFYEEVEREGYSKVLFEGLCNKERDGKTVLEDSAIESSKTCKAKGFKILRSLQKGVLPCKISRQKVLLNKLFGNMENVRSRVEEEKKGLPKRGCINKDEGASFKQSISSNSVFGKDEAKQSNDETGEYRQDGSIDEGENFSWKGREWGAYEATINPSQCNGSADGVCDKNKRGLWIVRIVTKLLQSGLGYTRKEDCDRGRWKDSQVEKVEISGQEKNFRFERFRVDSVEILERGSGPESELLYRENKVYDVTVDDYHNYFANGILVSNCHQIKNVNTSRFKVVRHIMDKNPDARITLLSGTPIKNRVNDMFAYLKIIGHPLGANYTQFLREYTISQKGRGGDKITGAKNTNDLWVKMSNFMLRKRLDDCVDLPDKIYNRIYFELEDYQKEYDEAVYEALENSGKTQLSSSVHTINIVTAKSKLKGIIELAENILENGEKVTIFSSYKEPLRILEQHFKDKCVLIDGSVPSHERGVLVEKFKNDDECCVFLGNMAAAGVGINLVSSSNMILTNFPLTPSELYQTIARLHRIGQTKKVNIWYTICKDTIDENLFNLIAQKAMDANAVVDNLTVDTEYSNIQDVLFKELREKYNIPEVKNEAAEVIVSEQKED